MQHPKLISMVCLSGLAVLLALLLVPATQGAAAPAAQSTPTQTPVATATPTASPTPQLPAPDAAEPNDTIGEARPIEPGGSIDNLTFVPERDVDYFVVFIKQEQIGLTLVIDTAITYGLDPHLRLLRPDSSLIAENDDASPTDRRSHLSVPLSEGGFLVIEVTNASIAPAGAKTYALETSLLTPQAAASAPTPGPAGGKPDAYENNYNFDHAPEIAVGQQLDNLNFLCPPEADERCGDNDFFAVSVKAGLCYIAQTLKLAPGIDTNLVVYGPQRAAAPAWAGNDDLARGVLESRARFCVPRGLGSTLGYLLVGNAGNRLPPAPAAQRTYSLRVDLETPASPTAAPGASGIGAPAGVPAAGDAPKGTAIVHAKSTVLRDAPDQQAAALQTLPEASLVLLQGQASGAWVRVQVANGVLPGWVYGPDLKRIEEDAAAAQPVSSTPVVRPGAQPDAPLPGATGTAQPTPHVVALQPTPLPVAAPTQRVSLAVSVLLVRRAPNAVASPAAVGPGTPTPRGGGLPGLAGVRVQLVDAFGELLAEAITPTSGEITLRRDLAPGTAVFLRVPGPGLQVPIDSKQPAVKITLTLGG